MKQIRLADFFSLALFSLCVLTFHIIVPDLGFKSLAFAVFAFATMIISVSPIKWGLLFLFLYIGLEGFLKVVSGYHPVIHIGADILVIFLTFKMIISAFIGHDKSIQFTPPFAFLFFLHFIWVGISLFNPYGLGLLPSLAGAKVYVTMFLLYFFGFNYTKSLKDADDFLKPFIIVVLLHTIFGIYQGLAGEQSVLSLHPGYAQQLAKFKDTAFRPFGLTNLPGGPAVFLAFMFPLVLYVIFTTQSWLMRIILSVFLPAGVFLFLLCQVRASLIKMIIASVMFLLGLIFYSSQSQRKLRFVLVSITIITGFMLYFLPQAVNIYMDQDEMNVRAIERSLTIFDAETVAQARRSVWPRFVAYLQRVPLGAGFSRVGGAAAKFTSERQEDVFFDEYYFFADNFWVASLIEVGIPGMLLLTLIISCLWWRGWKIFRVLEAFKPKMLSLSIFSAMTAMMIGLYASEGILANPDACFFWFFSGVLMKIPEIQGVKVS
jgi:hypothetical protein